jgi:hypothetical protein
MASILLAGHEGLGAINAGQALGVGEGMRQAGENRQAAAAMGAGNCSLWHRGWIFAVDPV